MTDIRKYFSLVKFVHTVFALPFAVVGFFLAIHQGYPFSWYLLVLVLLCMVFARSAAMGFNRYADRRIDAQNARTAGREIPRGAIAPREALAFVILNAVLFVITTYFINTLCFLLSPVALLVILGYSYTKRFTALSHFILGLGLSLAPLGAYLAVTAQFDLLPAWFSLAIVCWVSGFDIIYSLQDDAFDRKMGLFSVPRRIGRAAALTLSAGLHILSMAFIVLAGLAGDFTLWYWVGTSIFAGLLLYQHMLVKPDDLSRINIAFFTTNGIASIVFASFFLLELWCC